MGKTIYYACPTWPLDCHYYGNQACVTLPCVLRSEMLAYLALLCRQMNKQYAWNAAERFDGWELDVQDGPIKVTVITFTGIYARVVQAACIPKASSPIVRLTYRGSFFVGTGLASWDAGVARDILRWMMWPEEPLLPPTEEEDGRRQEAPKRAADGQRVPSGGSSISNKTTSSTNFSQSSEGSADGEATAGSA
ncbi:hypothetical protein B0H67DRAFT_392092 [Lasiosphaeris hirsuta]|uniref:Uncharacterized protein n=1 Tax=Lasiosphaeris hirsuta TaxID=260670 RepID=A0AA39ZSE6_9PEZI|nr:hypothetical protein B0H67DRAFT_392092 [Lasiosphaeris hirsuta]